MPAITDLLREEWAAHARDVGPGITGIAQALGGNAAAARGLGVSIRQVQRWEAWERGDRDPHRARNPDRARPSTRAQMERARESAAQNDAADAIRRKGIRVGTVTGDFSINNDEAYMERGRTIRKPVTIPPEELGDLLDAAQADEWERAASVFVREYFREYGVPAGSWGVDPDVPIVDAMQFRFG